MKTCAEGVFKDLLGPFAVLLDAAGRLARWCGHRELAQQSAATKPTTSPHCAEAASLDPLAGFIRATLSVSARPRSAPVLPNSTFQVLQRRILNLLRLDRGLSLLLTIGGPDIARYGLVWQRALQCLPYPVHGACHALTALS